MKRPGRFVAEALRPGVSIVPGVNTFTPDACLFFSVELAEELPANPAAIAERCALSVSEPTC